MNDVKHLGVWIRRLVMRDLTKDGWDEVVEKRGGVVYIKRETTLASLLLLPVQPAFFPRETLLSLTLSTRWMIMLAGSGGRGEKKRGGRGKAEPR